MEDGKELPYTITNPKHGLLLSDGFRIGQTELDFGVESIYTVYFTPTNPIPYIGAVKIIYPDNVKIPPKAEFEKFCSITTSSTFKNKGTDTYCKLDANFDSTDKTA